MGQAVPYSVFWEAEAKLVRAKHESIAEVEKMQYFHFIRVFHLSRTASTSVSCSQYQRKVLESQQDSPHRHCNYTELTAPEFSRRQLLQCQTSPGSQQRTQLGKQRESQLSFLYHVVSTGTTLAGMRRPKLPEVCREETTETLKKSPVKMWNKELLRKLEEHFAMTLF